MNGAWLAPAGIVIEVVMYGFPFAVNVPKSDVVARWIPRSDAITTGTPAAFRTWTENEREVPATSESRPGFTTSVVGTNAAISTSGDAGAGSSFPAKSDATVYNW